MTKKTLILTPISGADGQLIQVGDNIVCTRKNSGVLFFGIYQGFTTSDSTSRKQYDFPNNINRSYRFYYKWNTYDHEYICEKEWCLPNSVVEPKARRMLKR